jgi:hypothetical protein
LVDDGLDHGPDEFFGPLKTRSPLFVGLKQRELLGQTETIRFLDPLSRRRRDWRRPSALPFFIASLENTLDGTRKKRAGYPRLSAGQPIPARL